jgi:WbqC-like protein family
MQPYLFPYMGYLQLMEAADTFVVYDDVSYINRGWVNRNRILVNGQEYLFTIPLVGASQNKRINEIELVPSEQWKGKFLKTIEQAYKKAPQFEPTFALLQQMLSLEEKNLGVFAASTLQDIANYLKINVEVVPSSAIYQNEELKAQARILDICRQTQATDYVNAIGGQALYDKPSFAEHDIQLHFIRTQSIEYPQFKHSFVPWLSVIDVLMFNEVPTIQGFLKAYDLV